MRIHFERTGGFAGMRIAATVDTESLPPEEARELHQLVADASFFDLPPVMTAPTPGADQFQYKLTVEAKGRQHTVEVGDATVVETLWPLLRRLTVLARSARGSSARSL
jgi:hypothetical protein